MLKQYFQLGTRDPSDGFFFFFFYTFNVPRERKREREGGNIADLDVVVF